MIGSVAYLSMHTSPLAQPGTGHAGGMNVYIHELARTMADRGVDVVVFTRRTDPTQPDVVDVCSRYRVVHVTAGETAEVGIETLPRHVDRFAAGVVGWMGRGRHEPELIHSHYWLSGWCGVLVKEATGLPLINSFHTLGRVLDRSRRSGEPAVQPIRALTEDEVVARSDAVVAATPHEVDDLVAHYGADVRRLRVSPPGVDHTVFGPGDRTAARARIGLGDEPTVLFVGRIQAQKGIDIAIDAMAKVPERVRTGSGPPQMVIVGGPSGERGRAELRFLHRLAGDRGLAARIRFIPARPHDELTSFYRAADVLVMPSRSETFGLVAAEAQACGLPVIASDVGGLRYVVRSGVSGRIVQTLEPADFAHALVDVLDDPGERTRLAAGAVRNAVKFSWPSTARRLLGVYGEVGRP